MSEVVRAIPVLNLYVPVQPSEERKIKLEIELLHLLAAVQLLKRPPSRVIMVRTKEDAQAAPKRPKARGAMHDASIAAARARAQQAALKKKQKDKGRSDEDDELERNVGENSDDSSSSSESQHAEKEDALERTLEKSKTLSKERSTEDNLQSQIDRQKRVNYKK